MITINIDSENKPLAEIVYGEKTYKAMPLTVGDSYKLAGMGDISKAKGAEALAAMIGLIGVMIPEMPKETIEKLPMPSIVKLITELSKLYENEKSNEGEQKPA